MMSVLSMYELIPPQNLNLLRVASLQIQIQSLALFIYNKVSPSSQKIALLKKSAQSHSHHSAESSVDKKSLQFLSHHFLTEAQLTKIQNPYSKTLRSVSHLAPFPNDENL